MLAAEGQHPRAAFHWRATADGHDGRDAESGNQVLDR